MSANIFGDRLLLRREPAWHNVGEVFDAAEKLTATEAAKRARVDFPIEKWPLQAIDPVTGKDLATNQYAVVRGPMDNESEHQILGTVGEKWTPIQALDIAAKLDPLSQKYPVETVGALGKGERIFFSLDAGESQIAQEDHHLYYLVTDHRDGSGALQIAFTPVRVVCQNTLVYGLARSAIKGSLPHTRTIDADSTWYMNLLAQMNEAKDKVTDAMNFLAEVGPVSKVETDRIINAAYKASKPNRLKMSDTVSKDNINPKAWSKLLNDRKDEQILYQNNITRTERFREAANERLDVFNQDFPRLANTPWAAWQAVCETEDYRKGHADALGSAVFGDRAQAKVRAYTKAQEVARLAR